MFIWWQTFTFLSFLTEHPLSPCHTSLRDSTVSHPSIAEGLDSLYQTLLNNSTISQSFMRDPFASLHTILLNDSTISKPSAAEGPDLHPGTHQWCTRSSPSRLSMKELDVSLPHTIKDIVPLSSVYRSGPGCLLALHHGGILWGSLSSSTNTCGFTSVSLQLDDDAFCPLPWKYLWLNSAICLNNICPMSPQLHYDCCLDSSA